MTEFNKIRSERARQFAGQRSYTCRYYIKDDDDDDDDDVDDDNDVDVDVR